MRGKQAKKLRRFAAAMQKLEPVRVITAWRVVWWNPLSWVWKRWKRPVWHLKPAKFYEGIAKQAYREARGEV